MSKDFKYTVVIPSRNRQTYCISAIKSVMLAKREDVEIIVLDNSFDPELLPTLIKADGLVEKVTLVRSADTHLSMAENWERAVDLISGEWVLFLGDDDGCTLFTFDAFDFLTSTFKFLAFRWPLFFYKWPCFPSSERGRLKLPLSNGALKFYNSSDVIQASSSWKGAKRWPAIGPSVYHGLVNTEVIRQGRDKYGEYFIGDSVDYASGILNATLLDSYMRYSFPLTIMGASGYSNTAGLSSKALKINGKSQAEEFLSIAPVFDRALEGTKLSVPYIAYDFKAFFGKLGLAFELTSKQFFENCMYDLSGVRDQAIFESEKHRLLAYAKKIGLDYEHLLSRTYQDFDKPLGPHGKGIKHYLTVDASSLGYDGIERVCEILPKIYTEYSWFKQKELEMFANAVQREKLSA